MRVKWINSSGIDVSGRLIQFVMGTHGEVFAVVCREPVRKDDPNYNQTSYRNNQRFEKINLTSLMTDPEDMPV